MSAFLMPVYMRFLTVGRIVIDKTLFLRYPVRTNITERSLGKLHGYAKSSPPAMRRTRRRGNYTKCLFCVVFAQWWGGGEYSRRGAPRPTTIT